MYISRRDFLKYAGTSAAALCLSRLQIERVEEVFAATSSPPVIWLVGAACSGCSVSLMNAVNPTVDQLLLNTISLKYHPTLMAAAGEMAVAAAISTATQGNYILVVEGGVPTGEGGKYCTVWEEAGKPVTMAQAVSDLAARAQSVVAVGTCAAFGGIPSAFCESNVEGVGAYLGQSVINVPGCPPHPDWMIGTLAAAIAGTPPQLDSLHRPRAFFTSEPIHERCPRRESEEASDFGQKGRCLQELGCQGPRSHSDCDQRRWNNAQNWCIGANALCIGCTEPTFPAFPFHRNGEDDSGEIEDDAVASGVPCISASAPDPSSLTYRLYLPTVANNEQ
jgi:hydrogenase small subunit